MNLQKLLVPFVLLSLVACNPKTNESVKGVKPPPPNVSGTFLFVDKCHNEVVLKSPQDNRVDKGLPAFMGAAAGIIAVKAVEVGIDTIGNALQKAASEDVNKTMVSANLQSIEELIGSKMCLQIVRGTFEYAKANTSSGKSEGFSVYKRGGSNSDAYAPLKLKNDKEELFIELLPIVQNDVVTFAPLQVKSKSKRDVSLFVGYAYPDKDITAGDYKGRMINFGMLSPPKKGVADIQYFYDKKLSMINQTQWLSLSEDSRKKPVTLAVNVIETKKANKMLKFMSSVFNASKEDLKKEATAAVSELEIFKSSEQLKEAQIATETAKIENEEKFFVAHQEAMSKKEALEKICKTSGASKEKIFNAQKEFYIAQKKANVAALAADEDQVAVSKPTGICEKTNVPD